MDEFNNSLQNVRLLIFEALQSEECSENKLEKYRKYIKAMSHLFVTLDKDLESIPSDNDVASIPIIKGRHLSTLESAKHCLKRSIAQLEDNSTNKISHRSLSSPLDKTQVGIPRQLASMPSKRSIDILISEKPLNPIDSAKINLQRTISNTRKLLQSQNLSTNRKISVQLQLSRLIEETMSIARKHEENICKEKTNDLEQMQNRIERDINRFSILKGDAELAQLYRSSMMFYQNLLKGSKWFELSQMSRCPEESCLSFILKMNDNHPIVIYISKAIQTLTTTRESVDGEIKSFIEKIQQLSIVCCLIGNADTTDRNINSSEALFNLLCNYIFSKPTLVAFLYDYLFTSGEASMKEYDKNIALINDGHFDSSLLPKKLIKFPNMKEIVDKKVLQFGDLRKAYNPLDRMAKLCQIIRDLMSEISEMNPTLEIGADELVPILTYMLMKFDSSEIYLHIKYLELTVPSDYLTGMEGYILVSVSCAVSFCTSDSFKTYLSSSTS